MQRETILITYGMVEEFKAYLMERENASATIEKYVRDVKAFIKFSGVSQGITKEHLLRYKQWLLEHYSVSSANSMIVALNQFLIFMEQGRLRLKRVRVQKRNFESMGRELALKEFRHLVRVARKQGREQLAMMMETMCATGIRVSELKFFRVETIRSGMVKVWNKGKYRHVIIPEALRKKLLIYIGKNGITKGPVFVTRSGRAKNRSNIWREMKQLAAASGIHPDKIFPHNLRHLFARTFYKATKNLINLADILGHSNLDVTRLYASEGIWEWKRNLETIGIIEE